MLLLFSCLCVMSLSLSITVVLCLLLLIFMVLNIYNFIQRTEQVLIELDISAIEDYLLLLSSILNSIMFTFVKSLSAVCLSYQLRLRCFCMPVGYTCTLYNDSCLMCRVERRNERGERREENGERREENGERRTERGERREENGERRTERGERREENGERRENVEERVEERVERRV